MVGSYGTAPSSPGPRPTVPAGPSADDGEDPPRAGHALELVHAGAIQPDRGARDQVPDRIAGLRRNARTPIVMGAQSTGSTSNAGGLGAMARIWSSLESGPMPSKKMPTSAFH